jgi:xanthine dehydrogenase accessory factor
LFIDPVLPRARLVVIGDSPVAVALAGLAPRVGFQVSVIAQGADAAPFPDAHPLIATDDAAALADQVAPGSFVVVATQGRRDVQGLRAALALRAHTVWFVASARKAQVLRASLVESGADAEAVRAIVAPAGQPIGARTPEEIALSVLAAVVAARRSAPQAVPEEVASTVAASQSAQAPQPELLRPARPEIAPLPPLPEIAGSCCGGGATAEARAQSTAATTATKPEPVAAAKTAPKSCCGS